MACQPEFPLEVAQVPTPPMPHLASKEDALSLAASATHFLEYDGHGGSDTDVFSQVSNQSSRSSAQTSLSEDDGSIRAVLRMALERL